MNYELYMGEALAEAELAVERGRAARRRGRRARRGDGRRAHDRVEETDDPTAHAVVVALREAARKVGRVGSATSRSSRPIEPCPMCVGALLASDVEALVYAVPNAPTGAAGTVVQLAQHPACRAGSRS